MTTRTSLLSACAFALSTFGLTVSARAQLEPAPTDPAVMPAETTAAAVGGPELTNILQAPGTFSIRVPVVIGLFSGDAGKPISIPLDLYYGLNDNLTIGLTHSEGVVQSVMPYQLGRGVCLSGEENGCAKLYNNLGVDALFGFMKGILQLAGHFGLDFRSLDPGRIALRLGVLFQAPLATNLAIVTDPRVGIGLNSRDTNKDYLTLPLAVQFWPAATTRLAVRTGIGGYLDGYADNYAGFLGVFAGLGFSDAVEGFLAFDFPRLYGNLSSGDYRQLVIGVNFGM